MTLKQRWRNVRPLLVAPIIFHLVSLLGRTYRVTTHGFADFEDIKGGKIIAGWHGRSLLGALKFRGKGYWALISQSRDGEMQNWIFRAFGFQTIRGSTGRGGMEALVASIKELKKGGVLAFTPDGPRGPSGIVQPGVMMMAKKSGAAIVPAAVSCDRRWLFKSWDRYMIPKPFANCKMVFGSPIYVASDATEEQVEFYRKLVEREIHRLERIAESKFGHGIPNWQMKD